MNIIKLEMSNIIKTPKLGDEVKLVVNNVVQNKPMTNPFLINSDWMGTNLNNQFTTMHSTSVPHELELYNVPSGQMFQLIFLPVNPEFKPIIRSFELFGNVKFPSVYFVEKIEDNKVELVKVLEDSIDVVMKEPDRVYIYVGEGTLIRKEVFDWSDDQIREAIDENFFDEDKALETIEVALAYKTKINGGE